MGEPRFPHALLGPDLRQLDERRRGRAHVLDTDPLAAALEETSRMLAAYSAAILTSGS